MTNITITQDTTMKYDKNLVRSIAMATIETNSTTPKIIDATMKAMDEVLAKKYDALVKDAERLDFVIDKNVTMYKNHPAYMPYAICFDLLGHRVTVMGDSIKQAIDTAIGETE